MLALVAQNRVRVAKAVAFLLHLFAAQLDALVVWLQRLCLVFCSIVQSCLLCFGLCFGLCVEKLQLCPWG